MPAEDHGLDELKCFDEDKAPLAIASAGDLLVIQLGNDLRVSRDEGDELRDGRRALAARGLVRSRLLRRGRVYALPASTPSTAAWIDALKVSSSNARP